MSIRLSVTEKNLQEILDIYLTSRKGVVAQVRLTGELHRRRNEKKGVRGEEKRKEVSREGTSGRTGLSRKVRVKKRERVIFCC